jgi:7-keto-8-aminopelargonate synthetase-like enzyme
MFSAALCPAAVAASLAALKVIEAEPWRVKSLHERAASLRNGLKELGFETGNSVAPIIPVILGSNERTWKFARRLIDHGVLASAVIHPAVPRDQSRLRLCATASHGEDDIDAILAACAAVADEESRQ